MNAKNAICLSRICFPQPARCALLGRPTTMEPDYVLRQLTTTARAAGCPRCAAPSSSMKLGARMPVA